MNINAYIREDLVSFDNYETAPTTNDFIKLDANESPWLTLHEPHYQHINRYPQVGVSLMLQLAELYQISVDQLLLTAGSDSAIDYLVRLCCKAYRDNIIVCPPTFSMYRFNAQLQGVSVFEAKLNPINFELNSQDIIANSNPYSKLIFLCSPNNPTGTVTPQTTILDLCETFRDRALVVVDEAYIEFADTPSLSAALDDTQNLVILRTFSKAYGLAGARLGCVLANPSVISWLRRIAPPYPISQLSLDALHAALQPENLEKIKHNIKIIQNEREKLAQQISKIDCVEHCWPSQGNFILVRFNQVDAVYQAQKKQRIQVRKLSRPENCLRLSIGTPQENQQLINGLKKVTTHETA